MRESEFLGGDPKQLGKFGTLPFLKSIKKKYLKDIISRSKIRTYDGGEIITEQGTFDTWVYIILNGEVSIIKDGNEIANPGHARRYLWRDGSD